LTADGDFAGIVGEVGGFLDIGDKHVYIEIDNIKLVPIDDGSYAFVTRLNEEDLENLPWIKVPGIDIFLRHTARASMMRVLFIASCHSYRKNHFSLRKA
jgi:hypothetical protein